MLAPGAKALPLLGDPEHLTFDAFEESIRKDQRVARDLRTAVEDDRAQRHVAHAGLTERDHLTTEHVVLRDQSPEFRQHRERRIAVAAEHLQAHLLLSRLFIRSA